MSNNLPSHKVYAITPRGEGKAPRWTQIGVAWTNKDGSLNQRLFLPLLPGTDSQLRDYNEKREQDDSAE